jgi:ABC-type oligopeptide transport system substrate-binding subunit
VHDALAKPLVLYVYTDGRYPAMAAEVAADWRRVLGLKVQLTPLRWADYLQKASQGPGFDGAFHLGWATDATAPVPMFNDPQAFLDPLFTSAGTSNWTHWSDADFDFAFTEDAARATDVHDRAVHFQKLEQMLCAQMPAIPVTFSAPLYLVRTSAFASARPSYLARATAAPLLREIYRR